MKAEEWLRRADQILGLGASALATQKGEYLDAGPYTAFRAAALSFLGNVFGERHPYCTEFATQIKMNKGVYVQAGMGIVSAARDEFAGGWLARTRGLLSAEIFADFLEMADHLLAEGYKDAAAVIVGSSLEEHLRQLATTAGVDIVVHRGNDAVPKKADTLNADLVKAGAYSTLDQKSVTAWLGLRNKAAHGEYDQYDKQQVALMLEGVRQFISRVPA